MPQNTYWAWKDKNGSYHHVYPRRFLVEMCSPDGFKEQMLRGDGKIMEVTIKEVKTNKN